jgi:hypothetical protein
LGTSDREEAQRLVDQANVILSDESLWTPAARELAEKSFDRRIVEAFYDELVPTPRDSWALRENVIPLPADGFTTVQLLGTTGAGKTTLLRQFIGTGGRDEKFPSTSTSRTTTCDIEIVTDATDLFEAVVAFLPRDEVRQYVEECVCAAILSEIDGQPAEVVTRRFMEHSEQRFRLSYILGNPLAHAEEEDDLPEEFDPLDAMQDSEQAGSPTSEEKKAFAQRLEGHLGQITDLARSSSDQLARDLKLTLKGVSQEEKDVFEELLEGYLRDRDDFHALVDSVLDDIETRFDALKDGEVERDRGDWPSIWTASRSWCSWTEKDLAMRLLQLRVFPLTSRGDTRSPMQSCWWTARLSPCWLRPQRR